MIQYIQEVLKMAKNTNTTLPGKKKTPTAVANANLAKRTIEQPVKKVVTSTPYKPSAKAMELCEILRHMRPHGSKTEQEFVDALKKKIPGSTFDTFGNLHYAIPAKVPDKKPHILFSCHTDTVHGVGGMQQVLVDEVSGDAFINEKGSKGQQAFGACLGADDGTGVWLMENMIENKVPGYYIFHRAEEGGGLGSKFIRDNWSVVLADKKIDVAIAFDRKGTEDIITHQRGSRCASDACGNQLAALFKTQGLPYKLCQNGSFTDTANYSDRIPECFNLSVGYYKQHGPSETQDLRFAERLLRAVLNMDWSSLVASRDPSVIEKKKYKKYVYPAADDQSGWEKLGLSNKKRKVNKPDIDVPITLAEFPHIVEFITDYPLAVAMYFHDAGLSEEEMVSYIRKTTGKRDLADELDYDSLYNR
jgi:hypothetical protein